EAKGRAPAPPESADSDLAVAGEQLGNIVGHRVQIPGHLIRRQFLYGLGYGAAIRKLARTSALWPHSRQQIGSDCDVTSSRQLIGNAAHPVAQSKDFVDDDDGGSFVLGLRIDDEAVDSALAVLDRRPLLVTRR